MVGRMVTVLVMSGVLGLASGCSRIDSDDHRRDRDDGKHQARAARHARDEDEDRSPERLEQGRALYKKNCVACHGESGKGDGVAAGVLKPPPRDHTDRGYMSTLTDKQIADVIKMGGGMRGKPLMPSHPQFKERELASLVAYVRSLSEPVR